MLDAYCPHYTPAAPERSRCPRRTRTSVPLWRTSATCATIEVHPKHHARPHHRAWRAPHNLKNIDVEIPRNTLTVITGLSGSGKSSLAFDTIYAEGQRRYVETLSPYARQFLDQMERPDVDSIDGLSPAISIEQKTTQPQPALHRRHHHRDLRLPAPAVLLDRHAALPAIAARDLAADHRADLSSRIMTLQPGRARS